MRERRIWPAGVGVWKYDRLPTEMVGWMAAHGFTWMQFWSPQWADRGTPYCFELKTASYRDMAKLKTYLDYHYKNSDCMGVNLDCEAGWTDYTGQVLAVLRADYHRWSVFTGPLWDGDSTSIPQVDGIMAFYDFCGADRFPADVWWEIGIAAYYGKPLCLGVQPCNDSFALVDPGQFREALGYAAYADGLVMWSADRLWAMDEGRAECDRERLDAILAAVADVRQDPMPRRPTMPVLLTDPAVGRTNQLRRDRTLARIAFYAGYVPAFTHEAGAGVLDWATVEQMAPDGYMADLAHFYDMGWPGRPADIKARVEAAERALGNALADKLGGI